MTEQHVRGKVDPESRARTHLANERTFLAWLRTGLSMIALGLGAAQFLERDLVPGVPVTTIFAAFLVVCGVLIAVVGGVHYAHARNQIEEGQLRATSYATKMAVVMAIAVGVLAFGLVILLHVRG